MAYFTRFCCRICSLVMLSLIMMQATLAQTQSKKYDFSKVGSWLTENTDELGGRAVLVIFKDGNIIYNQAENTMTNRQKAVTKFIARRQGKDTDEALKDFNSKTRERIASCSKWLSAALVMTFLDDGVLKLDDTVGKFLPVMTANGKGYITISNCLSHMTGIKAGTMRETNDAMKNMQSMDEAIALIAKQPMEGEPGKTFHYSNAGLQLAAAVIEKISGKDFETLFAERIARPCGMINTDFGKGKVPLPAGGAWSTAEDYIRFLTMILNKGSYNGKQILSKNAIMEMQKNRVSEDVKVVYSPAEAGDWGYGFGEWVISDPLPSSPKEGEVKTKARSNAVTSPGLFGSFPWIDRDLNYAAFLFTFNINSKGRNERYMSLKKMVDEVLTK